MHGRFALAARWPVARGVGGGTWQQASEERSTNRDFRRAQPQGDFSNVEQYRSSRFERTIHFFNGDVDSYTAATGGRR